MASVHPVACWRIDDGLVLGLLLGTDLELAKDDEQGVCAALLAEAGDEAPAPVREARLERRVVHVRPTWHDGARRQVAADTVPLGVDVVVGRTASGVVAWLPRLGRTLGCVDETLLGELVDGEIAVWARLAEPEDLHRELRAPGAFLATVAARRRERAVPGPRERALPEILDQVAEREPGPRRKLVPGAWGREGKVAAVAAHLAAGRNVVVVGEAGAGKSTVLREAVAKAAEQDDARTFWRTTTHRIVAGARYLGEWQERADAVAEALAECEGTLWIEDLLELFTFRGSPAESIAAYWRSALAERRFGLVGELVPRAWEVVRSVLPEVARTFEVVEIDELGLESTRASVDRFAELAEAQVGVPIAPEARRRALRLLQRFVRHERFPSKAIRLLRSLVEERRAGGVTEEHVVDAFVRRTGLPRVLVDDALPLTGAAVAEGLGRRIVGQPRALEAASRVVLTWKAGLDDPDRPVATLLFAGPTGVGKTATAKALAEWCYGAGAARSPLVRVDMSELGSPWQVERVLGSRQRPGTLVAQVRERPFAVVLLDEVEKAHPLFFDLLLGVLDEGRLVDAVGRETDFRGTVLVMTTNLGTRTGASLGFAGSAPAEVDTGAIRSFFRPEFVNRIDEIVTFSPLDRAGVRRIARLELAALEAREGLRGRGIGLSFTDAVVERVAAAGFDPLLGARPLRRAIEQHVVAALGRLLVDRPELAACDLLVDVGDDDAIVVR